MFGFQNTRRLFAITHRTLAITIVESSSLDLGYIDDETCRLEKIENPSARKSYLRPRNEL